MTQTGKETLREQKLTLAGSGELFVRPSASSQPFRYRACFVRAGALRGADGAPANIRIDPEALSTNAAKFNGRAVFIDHAGFCDHPSLSRLAGVTAGARYNPQEQAVEGVITLNSTPAGELAAEIIDDLLANPTAAPDVGLSIVAFVRLAPQPDEGATLCIRDLRHVESVDLVFQPASDARILQKLSAIAQNPTLQGDLPMTDQTTHPTAKQAATSPAETASLPGAASLAGAGSFAETGSPADAASLPYAGAIPPNTWQEALAESASAAMLAASGLPEAARQRLAQQHHATPGMLRAAIDAERRYLASLSADSVISIGGAPPRSPQISGMLTSLDKIQLALDALFQGSRPPAGIQPLSGVRELYHLLSGDYEMTGVYQGERIQLANVNSSTMSNMVANALNKVVAQEFIAYPQWWSPIVIGTDFSSLQAVKWITLGWVGELPTVAEGAAYTELTWDDKYETAPFVKKGGYLGITMEAIDKDDTSRLRNAPRALAQAAWLTLSKSISGIFTQNAGVGPTLSDATALFDNSRANLGSSALSITSYLAARTAMRKFTELNSGERLGALTAPKYLLVPPDLEITALQVLSSEFDYGYALANAPAAPANPLSEGGDLNARMNFARQRVIVVDLWTDTKDWAAVADPRLYPTIGLGFRYGRQPEIFSVASPTAGLMFTNDTMPIKVRFVYACGPIDWRGLYKANVA